jgi:ubiquitin-conjugating enzyme E2 A/ubiquitin-conjugating enzyme E2 I
MNIYSNGDTCIDILNNKIGYTPARTCVEIFKGLEGFLYAPNPKSPTIRALATLFNENKA